MTNRCDLLFGFMLVEASGFAAVTMALGQGLSGVSDGIWVMPLITVLGIMVAEFAFRLVEWRFGLKRADPRGEPE